jgi:glycerol-3-phosphate acyltransferase PlsY
MFIFQDGLITKMANEFHLFSQVWHYQLTLIAFVVISIAVSYLLGSVNSAIIVSKLLYKEDIRTHGSGNAGMTNMLRTYGLAAAALTLIGDMLKTAIAIFFTASLLGISYNNGISLNDGYCYMAGLFAVLGHVFPCYYGFKGGKGVLVTATMALILTPVPFAILLAVFVIIVFISRYVSLGSVSVAVLYPVTVHAYVSVVFGGQQLPGIMALCTIILAIFIVWCHRENLKRISQQTERKISIGKREKNDD